MIRNITKALYILGDAKKRLIMIFFMTILTSGMEAAGIGIIGPFLSIASNPDSIHKNYILKSIYSLFSLHSNNQFVVIFGLITISIFLAKSVLYICTSSYIYNFSYQQRKELVLRVLSSYLSAPYIFHLNKNTAKIIENITSKTQIFTEDYLLPLQGLAVNSFIIVAILFVLAKTDLVFLEIILFALVIIFFVFERFGKLFRSWGRAKVQANEEIICIVNHSLGGLKETKIIGCESYFENKMEAQTRQWSRAVYLFKLSQVFSSTVVQTSLVLVVILFICISINNPNQDFTQLTSVVGIFATASLRLVPASNFILQSVGRIRNATYAVDVIYNDLKETGEIEKNSVQKEKIFCNSSGSNGFSGEQNSDRLAFNQLISLNCISFRYPNSSQDVIKSISLKLNKGESIALIGESGAGKTTLVDIFLGLLEPSGGYIDVDGIPIHSNIRSWQNIVGYIPQSIFLTDDTIERNIAFGLPDELIDTERLNQAIEMAQLSKMVEALPDGIKTSVGERGVRLSGGQRQRIGIARAIYHEREILVLDEATSALDDKTEQLVTEAIKSLAGKKTIIIITHRLNSVKHCDHVYLLENGCIAKSGSYSQVVQVSN